MNLSLNYKIYSIANLNLDYLLLYLNFTENVILLQFEVDLMNLMKLFMTILYDLKFYFKELFMMIIENFV